MTREEALKILKEPDRIGYNVIHANDEETIKYNTKSQMALNMAIKALEQEPCENCISRQAAEKITWEESSYIDPINALTEVREKIRALPSIAPQQKVGKWIEEVDDYGEVMRWHCDKCYEDSGFTTTCKWDYCPNCGAKMEVNKDD